MGARCECVTRLSGVVCVKKDQGPTLHLKLDYVQVSQRNARVMLGVSQSTWYSARGPATLTT